MANLEKVDVKWGIWKILVNSAYRIILFHRGTLDHLFVTVTVALKGICINPLTPRSNL